MTLGVKKLWETKENDEMIDLFPRKTIKGYWVNMSPFLMCLWIILFILLLLIHLTILRVPISRWIIQQVSTSLVLMEKVNQLIVLLSKALVCFRIHMDVIVVIPRFINGRNGNKGRGRGWCSTQLKLV